MTVIKTYPETPSKDKYVLEARVMRKGIPDTDWYVLSTHRFAWVPRLAIRFGLYYRQGFEYRIVHVKEN